MMNTKYLFPHYFKVIGWILFIPALILGFFVIFYNYEVPFLNCKVFALFNDEILKSSKSLVVIKDNITNELAGVFFILGTIFIAFSREKHEDEFFNKIRLESLLWATYINYGLLILCFVFLYGFSFFSVMLYNLFTLLIFFLLRYNLMKYKLKRQLKNEE